MKLSTFPIGESLIGKVSIGKVQLEKLPIRKVISLCSHSMTSPIYSWKSALGKVSNWISRVGKVSNWKSIISGKLPGIQDPLLMSLIPKSFWGFWFFQIFEALITLFSKLLFTKSSLCCRCRWSQRQRSCGGQYSRRRIHVPTGRVPKQVGQALVLLRSSFSFSRHALNSTQSRRLTASRGCSGYGQGLDLGLEFTVEVWVSGRCITLRIHTKRTNGDVLM